MSSNYISGIIDYNREKVIIWERSEEGRLKKVYNCPYYFYIEDENGKFISLDNKKLTRLDFENYAEFEKTAQKYKIKYESDISPLDKILMEKYYKKDAPKLHYCFIDIEVDYQQNLGFSSPDNPYAPINVITIYLQWLDEYVTVAVPPRGLKDSSANIFSDLTSDINSNLIIVSSEYELLLTTLEIIEDCDLLSGWNSDFFDIPYLIKRTEMVLGKKMTQRWCFPGADYPKFKEIEKFGIKNITVKLSGRIHLDYLQLFKKFTFEGRTSWSLASIADEELEIPKLEYDGTLEELYNGTFCPDLSNYSEKDIKIILKDYKNRKSSIDNQKLAAEIKREIIKREIKKNNSNEELLKEYDEVNQEVIKISFYKFILYNIRDVQILHKLDEKFNFIALANQMAHDNTVMLESVLGTVKFVETGIINYAHHEMNKIVSDKELKPSHGKVEGAIVMTPKIGLHEWIGSCDINSLYPSCIRSLNISPEKIIGQFTDFENDWYGIFKEDNISHILVLENGEKYEATGKEWKNILKENKWAISAYGTVFDQSNDMGVIPAVLTEWFNERKKLQTHKKEWLNKLAELEKQDNKNENEINYAKEMISKYDLLQNTKKIQLNSTYGALLNVWFRFFDERMGASVTATGRQITSHMIRMAGKYITNKFYELNKTSEVDSEGKVNHIYTTDCPVIIYGDTDSVYFKTNAKNKEEAIRIADETANFINSSFQNFMKDAFLCNENYDNLIRAVREIVGIRGLFQAKKKYIIRVVDQEGKPVDKLKAMGSEIKKSDTPKIIQKFLKDVLNMVLDGKSYNELETFINNSRKTLFKNDKNLIAIGIAKAVNNLDMFYDEWTRLEKTGKRKVNLPGHVRASINYNEYVQKIEGKGAKILKSGDKVLIFYLKPNAEGFKSIAIPSDLTKFPKWFNNFVIDKEETETKMIDAKLEGIFNALGYDVPTFQRTLLNKIIVY
jgi:DNA polymerase elongation subunit (family B)